MRPLLALALATLLLLPGCSDDGDGGGGEATTTPAPTTEAPASRTVDVAMAAVGVYPIDPAFDPERIEVPAGATVNLTFTNNEENGLSSHDFVVEGIEGASTAVLGPGSSTTITFTAPDEPGEYVFFCSVGDHRSRGMEGVLAVV